MARPNPPDLAALGFGDEVDDALRVANPNPTRQGCPPHDVLVALSRRERPIEDPAYEHLLDCSPCYVEVRDMQRTHLMAMHERPARRWWLSVAAAAIVVVALGAWWLATGRNQAPGGTGAPAVMQVTLDLRPYSVTRSPTASDALPPLELPRGVVELTLLLPVGSEPGPYEVQLLDVGQKSLVAGHGDASLRDFMTTLNLSFDLRSTDTGSYQLAVRREGDSWRIFPVALR